jgi:hypothetical protein
MLHVLPYGETTRALRDGKGRGLPNREPQYSARQRTKHVERGAAFRPQDEQETAEPPLKVGGRPIPELDAGFFIGLMVGEGHFGGDARQPHITLRMHTDHAAVFAWLMERFPGGRLYGPYAHSGRRYFQWMARGPYLRDEIVPLLDRYFTAAHSGRAHARYERMKATYGLGRSNSTIGERG